MDAARKTLGVSSCPSGKSDRSIQYMQEKAQKWLDKAMVGRIHRRSIWFSLERQFWPSVGYCLCSSTATLKELKAALQKKYFKVLPLGGIIRSAKREIRQLSHGFYGGGCPHPGVEAAVVQANKMLMHYGCKSGVGIEMQISCELMMAELGLSFQPFLLPYSQYQALLTHSWMKTLWGEMSEFGFELMINNFTLKFPRGGDKRLMECFISIGYKGKELICLNRVRVHQQVLFLSDILCAAGKRVHAKYLHPRNLDETWTNLGRFPNKDPTESDFELWCEDINQIAPGYCLRNWLGAWQHPGHKIWEWSCSDDRQLLYKGCGSTLEVFERTATNRYTTTNTTIELDKRGQICSVEEVNTGWKIISTSTPAETKTPPDSFLDVLEEWGCTWMWEDLRLTGGTEWLSMAIDEESLVAVTDGSYLREMYPNICSAAFILECNKGRGRLVGSFPEHTLAVNAYQGELLGLMAVHLLLLSVNKTEPHLSGLVKIYSDCLGALSRVAELSTQNPYEMQTL